MKYPKHINVPTEKVKELASTNDYLAELCKQGKAEEFHTVIAEKQTSGKGQRGNCWESEPGKNLTFSIVLYPTAIEANKQFHLSMLVSIAIIDTLTDYTDGFSIKWPNDIYWHDKKICGILIENELEGKYLSQSIIGIGLNVNQSVFLSSAPNPVSLFQIIGKEIDKDEVFSKIIHALLGGYKALEDNFIEASAYISHLYKKFLYRKDDFHLYQDKEGTFEARIHDVGHDGYLYLEDTGNNIRKYAFKEVTYIIHEQRE
jgi:BirA family biotin operon repressor/biotin-[acetyl-CoA-carboxylase] ligase